MITHPMSATTSENRRLSASKLNEKSCALLTTTFGTAAVTGPVYATARTEAKTRVMSAIRVET